MNLWTTQQDDAGIVIATYTNPPMNYFCAAAVGELLALIDSWRAPAVRVIVLTGGMAGRFITHYSVEELLALATDTERLRAIGTALTAGYHALLQQLHDLPKPVIVAMNGDTMGGGFELSLASDIRIAQDGDHRFGLPEVRLGILPGGTGTQRLARLIGAGHAIEFIMRGRVVPPAEALRLRLVHEVVADAAGRARALAGELAALPAVALAQVKHAIYAGSDVDLAAGLEIEGAAFLNTMLSEDARRLMKAYVDVPFAQRRALLETPFG